MDNETKKQIPTKNNWINWIISEVSFFAFLYYAQYLLDVGGNVLLSTLVLWILLNISIIFCPVIKSCYK